MFAQKLLLSAVAVVGLVNAQTPTACADSTATITMNSAADASLYANCDKISGSVLIGTEASGTVNIDGPSSIGGNLLSENTGNLVTLSSNSITSIGGTFHLKNLTVISTLTFNKLTSVNIIEWISLPNLATITFPAFISKASSITISNTFLDSLTPLNLMTVGTLNINNNQRLQSFSAALGNISVSLDINANNKALTIDFPSLTWAANMTFRNVSSVNLPELTTINGSLGFYGNYMTSLSAPNLTTVGNFNTGSGSLAIDANANLANITMDSLTSVGGAFQIANNTALGGIDFPKLTDVGGAIDFSGNFTTPQLKSLNNVKGGFNMQSTTNIDCSGFKAEQGNIIQGLFTCLTTPDATSGVTGTGTSTGTSGSASSTHSKGAAASFGVNEALAGVSFVGGLLQMLL